jgi:hypothetical protein
MRTPALGTLLSTLALLCCWRARSRCGLEEATHEKSASVALYLRRIACLRHCSWSRRASRPVHPRGSFWSSLKELGQWDLKRLFLPFLHSLSQRCCHHRRTRCLPRPLRQCFTLQSLKRHLRRHLQFHRGPLQPDRRHNPGQAPLRHPRKLK